MKSEDRLFVLVCVFLVVASLTIGGQVSYLLESIQSLQKQEVVGLVGNTIGAVCTLIAAVVAWLVVQPQLTELRKQSAQRHYELARDRAAALSAERGLIMDIIDGSISLATLFARACRSVSHGVGYEADRRNVEDALLSVKEHYAQLISTVPPWGSLDVQWGRMEFENLVGQFVREARRAMTEIKDLDNAGLVARANEILEMSKKIADRGGGYMQGTVKAAGQAAQAVVKSEESLL